MARPADLGPAFLRRVRIMTIVLGAVGVLCLTVYGGVAKGAAGAAGLAVSILNLMLLEGLFTRMLRPQPIWGAKTAIGVLVVKFLLLLGGTFLALGPLHLPPVWFVAGFSLVFGVVVLKVLGMLLTGPRTEAAHPGAGGSSPAHAPEGTARSGRGPAAGGRSSGTVGLLVLLLLAGACVALPLLGHAEEGAASGTPAVGAAHGEAAQGAATEGAVTHGEEAGAESAHGEGGRSEHEEEIPELPSLIVILRDLNPGAAWALALFKWQEPIYAGVVMLFLSVVAVVVYRRRAMIPGKLQNAVEMLVESFSNFILGILGPKGKEFIPFLGTLFFYIWFNNLQGLVPFFKSPTSVYNTTLALAICVFLYVQYTGITKLGPIGYIHHMLGSPGDVIGWCMVPLMLPLHLIEEVAKPVSLSLRLFGNILGEDVLLGVFAGLGVLVLSFMKLPIGIPLHLPFIFLALLLSTIQALVFTLLASIYFLQMLPHEEHEEGH